LWDGEGASKSFQVLAKKDNCAEKRKISAAAGTIIAVAKNTRPCPFL